ncbi:MAG: FAD-dependent monooxygenase [Planctomycetes bacterium]|nr:FAD-dependent monooxygenase [Planctomycetota bacterium]
MTGPSDTHIVIAGGGLSGALLAVFLGQRGFRVSVYEHREDIRTATIVRGRSINLAISTRGLHALSRVGLEKKCLEMCVPMTGRLMHSVEGELTYQPYGTEESQAIHSVSRGGLNQMLLEEADELDNVTLHFQERCVDVDFDRPAVTFENARTGERTEVTCDVLIGADGAFSAVRGRMQRRDRFTYSQTYLDHGYKELHIPPAENGGFRIEKNRLHIWPRHQSMMIALPNDDGSFTVTLFWPLDGDRSFSALSTESEVRAFFERWYEDAIVHMPTYVDDYLSTPASSLVTVRCYPWSVAGRVSLVGDACHAVVPFYGQGMNAAFEDCEVLADCIDEFTGNWHRILDEYQRRRKRNVDALSDLAIENFVEMRDRVASPWFLFKKQLGKICHRLFPTAFVPLYSMVTFSRIPYADARERSRRQVKTIQWTLSVIGVILLLLVWRLVWH